jgi:uncharacterized flavoprotein (TIGR03862 family)
MKIAVIGSGPAGLMAASEIARQGHQVSLFEKRSSLGRKLLIAGSSGLNITHAWEDSLIEFSQAYGESQSRLHTALKSFSPENWITWIESHGISTFLGTSRRYFIDEMKAPPLIQAWRTELETLGVDFVFKAELADWRHSDSHIELGFKLGSASPNDSTLDWQTFDHAILALGGGSWEPNEQPLRWIELLKSKGIPFREFVSSNCGFQVDWPKPLLEEAVRQPIKNCTVSSSRGSMTGDLMITEYGLEGTPIYTYGEVETITLDLKPDLSEEAWKSKLTPGTENLSPIRRLQKRGGLCLASQALAYHLLNAEQKSDLGRLVHAVKNLKIHLRARQPLSEAISSSGGILWSAVDSDLRLIQFPRISVAGEMLNWDAPTGGYLIQGSVSLGHLASRWLDPKNLSLQESRI